MQLGFTAFTCSSATAANEQRNRQKRFAGCSVACHRAEAPVLMRNSNANSLLNRSKDTIRVLARQADNPAEMATAVGEVDQAFLGEWLVTETRQFV